MNTPLTAGTRICSGVVRSAQSPYIGWWREARGRWLAVDPARWVAQIFSIWQTPRNCTQRLVPSCIDHELARYWLSRLFRLSSRRERDNLVTPFVKQLTLWRLGCSWKRKSGMWITRNLYCLIRKLVWLELVCWWKGKFFMFPFLMKAWWVDNLQ